MRVRILEAVVQRDGESLALWIAENVGTCIRQAERSEWMRQTIERQQRQLRRHHVVFLVAADDELVPRVHAHQCPPEGVSLQADVARAVEDDLRGAPHERLLQPLVVGNPGGDLLCGQLGSSDHHHLGLRHPPLFVLHGQRQTAPFGKIQGDPWRSGLAQDHRLVDQGNVPGEDTPNFGGPDGRKDRSAMTYYQSSHGHNQSVINGIGRIGQMWGGKSALWDDETMADVVVEKAREYINKRDKKKPFFLYFAS